MIDVVRKFHISAHISEEGIKEELQFTIILYFIIACEENSSMQYHPDLLKSKFDEANIIFRTTSTFG